MHGDFLARFIYTTDRSALVPAHDVNVDICTIIGVARPINRRFSAAQLVACECQRCEFGS